MFRDCGGMRWRGWASLSLYYAGVIVTLSLVLLTRPRGANALGSRASLAHAAPSSAPRVYLLHDNPQWMQPVSRALQLLGVPSEEWRMPSYGLDLGTSPPSGVFFTRVSPSSHTRGVHFSMEAALTVLQWIRAHGGQGRALVNSPLALEAEMSKAFQVWLLRAHGVPMPETEVAFGQNSGIVAAARRLALQMAGLGAEGALPAAALGGDESAAWTAALAPLPKEVSRALQRGFFLKPSRGGSGHGIRFFRSLERLAEYVRSSEFVTSLDGAYTLQARVGDDTTERAVYRLEIVDDEPVYVLRIQAKEPTEWAADDGAEPTEAGRRKEVFNNCPCSEAEQDREKGEGVLESGGGCSAEPKPCEGSGDMVPRFRVVDWRPVFRSHPEVVARVRAMLHQVGAITSGVEFVFGADGLPRCIDANLVNSNYNEEAERAAGIPEGDSGAMRVARVLAKRLQALHGGLRGD